MNLIRFIFYSVIVYFFIRLFRSIINYLKTPEAKESVNRKMKREPSKLNIDKKDIIEAEFTEIRSSTETKEKV